MTLSAGSRLGPYEILSPLGSGGMGEVYRARDTRLKREVAVKVLPESVAGDPERLRRFEQEALAASALNHPNIVTVHDFGDHAGAPYVVTELLEGETLRERIARGPLAPRKAAEHGVQIAAGLAAVHERGIVHRDLKPENVFVTREGHLKILDFGLAKLQPPVSSSGEADAATQAGTEPGVVMGTVGYMSPEQVRGEPADHRSDIFALGAVLYEMLTGTRAFGGASAVETLNAILRDQPEVSPATRSLAPSLARVVERCLEKSPSERFQSARDLAFALSEASGASTATGPMPPPAAGRRRPLTWAAIGAFALAAVLVAVVALRGSRRASAPDAEIRSLAVLPLENLSRDVEQEYFADGMTEALITKLAQIRSLRVISRTSVMAYKAGEKSLPQIGRELDVDAVVEGSVQRSGDRVRVTAQLVHAATDRHLWARSYERDLKDALSLQSEIAREVASEIRAAVTPEETARLARATAVDPQVHEIYLKGRFHLNKGIETEIERAIALFEQATARDPSYARAWAGLADAWAALTDVYRAPFDVLPKAKAAAQRALELDETLAEAHTSLGMVHLFWDWDWAASERELRRAIELEPSLANAHHWYGLLLSAVGRHDEAIAASRLATRYDPLGMMIAFDAGWTRYMARHYDEAIAQFREALEVEPRFGWAHGGIALAEVQKRRFPEAVKAGQAGAQVDDSPLLLAIIGGVYAASGEPGKAREMLQRLDEIGARRYVCPYEIAVIHLYLGDADSAFRSLEKGFRDRSSCMPSLNVDPRFDRLREDPRFVDLVRRIGFPA